MFSFFRRTDGKQLTAPASTVAGEVRSVASPEEWLIDLFGGSPGLSGVSVTGQTAMRVPAVRAAVQAIAEAVGMLPCRVITKARGEAPSPVSGHPVDALLNHRANDWTPAGQFREQLTRDALLHGNGFAHIGRDANGSPRELIRLRPGLITVDTDIQDPLGPPVYRVNGVTVPRQNIIHIRCPLGTGESGVSPVQDAKEAIGLALVMERHAARLFGRGARPSGLLKFPQRLGNETAKRIKQSWQAAHAGENSGGTAVLEEGGEFQSLTLNSVDAQFAELRAFQISEIARAFRVPPVLLQDYGRATWGNSSEMARQFVNFTLQPWLTKIEGELALKLLNDPDLVLEHDTDQLTNADPEARARVAQMLRAAGVATANELRRPESLPPHPDGDVLGNPFTTSNADPAKQDQVKPDATNEGGGNG